MVERKASLSLATWNLAPLIPRKLTASLEIRRRNYKRTWAFPTVPVGQMARRWAEGTAGASWLIWADDGSSTVPKKWESVFGSTKQYLERRQFKGIEQGGKTEDSS